MRFSIETLGGLEPISPAKQDIRTHRAYPNLIVRTDRSTDIDQTRAEIQEIIQQQKVSANQLKAAGIAVPRFVSIEQPPSAGSSEWGMFTISEKVHGVDLTQISSGGEIEIGKEMDATFSNLVTYYHTCLETNTPALSDIMDTEQWMWGHTKKDPTNRIYLVDIDPFVMQFRKENVVYALLKFMRDLEYKFGMPFEDSRKKFVEIF